MTGLKVAGGAVVGYGAWTGGGAAEYQLGVGLTEYCSGRGGGGRFGCTNGVGVGCVDCCGGREVADRDCGRGEP